jgi:hypothetical protein
MLESIFSFMTETFSTYTVDEDSLPSELDSLSDQEKYDRLVAAVQSKGIFQATLEMTVDDFIDALEALDEHMNGDRFLPIGAMNNSPFNILEKNGDCPYFGYFDPADVQRLVNGIENLSDDALDTIESFETHSEAFQMIRSAAHKALADGLAVAIIHG